MGEQPRWEKRRNTQMAIALMILGNWWQSLVGARANDKKSAVFGRKQAFSDKKTTFRRFLRAVRWNVAQFRNTLFILSSGVLHDPHQNSLRSRHHRRGCSYGLFRHDRPEERCQLPDYEWFLGLRN